MNSRFDDVGSLVREQKACEIAARPAFETSSLEAASSSLNLNPKPQGVSYVLGGR